MNEKNLNCNQSLKHHFNVLSKSISHLALPSYLQNFEEFQKLEINFVIKALYDIAIDNTHQKTIVLQNIHKLTLEFIAFKPEGLHDSSYPYLIVLETAVLALKTGGDKLTPSFLFMKKINNFLFTSPLTLANDNPENIKVETGKLVEIMQSASDLYYSEHNNAEKENLKKYLAEISAHLLKKLDAILHIIIHNLDSKNYFSTLEIFKINLEKTLAIKGIKMLVSKTFLAELEKQQKLILLLTKTEQFFNYDFSKKLVKKNQEKTFLTLLQIFSENSMSIVEMRPLYIFKYYSSIKFILAHASNSKFFKNKVNEYYEMFKQKILNYFENYPNKFKTPLYSLMAIFSLMFLGIEAYYPYCRDIELTLENLKNVSSPDGVKLYEYLCLYMKTLNYISFSQARELTIKTEEIQGLEESLKDIKKTDDWIKYLIQEKGEALFEYFAKNIILPTGLSINFENEHSIEKLTLLAKEARNTLFYLIALRNFYDAFFILIQSCSETSPSNSILKNFLETLERQTNQAEQQLNFIETMIQKHLNSLTENTVPVIVSYFKSADKELEILESELEKDLERQLASVITTTIPIIITYFRLNSLGHFKTEAKNYIKNYSYQAKLTDFCKFLTTHFPKMDLSSPKTWENLLLKAFLEKNSQFDYSALIFIVGFSYQEKGNYKIAEQFYNYCLQHAFFETCTQANKGVYLVTKQLIQAHINICKEKLNPNFSAALKSSTVIPAVFQSTSDPVYKALDTANNQNSRALVI